MGNLIVEAQLMDLYVATVVIKCKLYVNDVCVLRREGVNFRDLTKFLASCFPALCFLPFSASS
jgi:hypothetical protein